MKHEVLRNYIKQIINEDFSFSADKKTNSEKKGWFSNFLSLFKQDKGLSKHAANMFIDDFEEKTLIELPDAFKQRVYAFSDKNFPFAMKKTNGDEQKAVRLMSRVIANAFSPELRKFRDEYLNDHDDDVL